MITHGHRWNPRLAICGFVVLVAFFGMWIFMGTVALTADIPPASGTLGFAN
jgi:hypothetical protein